MHTVLLLVRKELLQVFRDRAMVVQVCLLPIVQLLLLSNAATFEVRRTRAHVVDLDRTVASREIVTRLAASGRFAIDRVGASPRAAEDALRAGRVALVVTVPAGLDAALARGEPAPVRLAVDAQNGAAAGLIRAYATGVLADVSSDRAADAGAGAGATSAAPRLDVRVRGWYNPSLDYRHFMVPGILVLLVTLVGTLATAMNIARERELGTLEQLNATPLARWQFVAGKLIPFWLLAFGELAAGLLVARVAFDVPMRGSLALVFAAGAVYLVAALAIGLLISTVARTQQQAMFVTFFVVMVYTLMSGLFTPVDGMPAWARAVAELNPIKHFVVVMRAVLVKGADLRAVAAPLAALCAFAAVAMTVAIRQHSKTTA